MSLLSGGEQAMTAVALIFAVYHDQPSANLRAGRIRRPARRLQRRALLRPVAAMTRSSDTRFIIITHNPSTMARMGPPLRRHDGRARRIADRHRQGALRDARVPARRAGRRRLHAGALRRPRQIRVRGRNAVRQASRLDDGAETDPTADGDRQAIRLHRGNPSIPTWRIRRCSTTSRRCATTP